MNTMDYYVQEFASRYASGRTTRKTGMRGYSALWREGEREARRIASEEGLAGLVGATHAPREGNSAVGRPTISRRPKEMLIFVRGQWEIAHIETIGNPPRTAWHRRDSSWICDEAGPNEIKGVAELPPAPRVR